VSIFVDCAWKTISGFSKTTFSGIPTFMNTTKTKTARKKQSCKKKREKKKEENTVQYIYV
jgi:hypothetical protein